jgi:hypothetical protein
MNFKVLHGYGHGKDKDTYTSWRLSKLVDRVYQNPNRMTFNPVEVYFQDLHKKWNMNNNWRVFFYCYFTFAITCLLWVLYLTYMGIEL